MNHSICTPDDLILVTGPTGFIGTRVVQILLEYGFTNLRCFVRPLSRLDQLQKVIDRFAAAKKVQFLVGDLLSPDDCSKAASDASIVYHLAGGIDKSFSGAFMGS